MLQKENSKTKKPLSWFRFSLFLFLVIFNFNFALDGTVLAKPVASDNGDGGGGGGGITCKEAYVRCCSSATESFGLAAATCAQQRLLCPPCVAPCLTLASTWYAGLLAGCTIGYANC